MKAIVKNSTITGEVVAPCSKSIAHRMLICAGLAKGVSTIRNITFSQDVLATIDCLKALGVKLEINNDVITVSNNKLNDEEILMNARESGSTLRFFIPLALRLQRDVTFIGSEKLLSRPLDVYQNLCDEKGWKFELTKNKLVVNGKLTSGKYSVRGDISSQFISGLLFALAMEENDSEIKIIGKFESASYVDLTIDVINKFGGKINIDKNTNTIYILGNNELKSGDYFVEGDQSNAAFLDCFNYLNGAVKVDGLNPESLQGDKVYKQYFERVSKGYDCFDLADCPDLGPIMMALAALKDGAKFIHTKRLAAKECDRGLAMKEEIERFGGKVNLFEDEIVVEKCDLHCPSSVCQSHNDHRIVMSIVTMLTVYPGEIEDVEAVNKSFPDYFDKMKKLNLEVELYDN